MLNTVYNLPYIVLSLGESCISLNFGSQVEQFVPAVTEDSALLEACRRHAAGTLPGAPDVACLAVNCIASDSSLSATLQTQMQIFLVTQSIR